MKRIALISITLNAVNPMTEYLLSRPDVVVINYLDSYLSEKIKEDGKVTDQTMGRMLQMLANACSDGADGIILTCTVFSPYIDTFQTLFSVPVIGADTAMFEQVSKAGGSIALLCTYEATLKPSEDMLKKYCLKYGNKCRLEVVWLKEAYEKLQKSKLQEHNDYIVKQVEQMDGVYDNIVLAQISMTGAADGVTLKHSRLFASPQAAYEKIIDLISEGNKR